MNINLSLINKVEIPNNIILETETFFKSRGMQGYEAKIYWIGQALSSSAIAVTRIFIPKQIARKSLYGVSVEVPEEGNLELIQSLSKNEFVLIKLHTHPRQAYLSETDINNPFFRHEGAISIVVPNFCSQGLGDLTNCCVNIFRKGHWLKINPQQIKDTFLVTRCNYE